MAVMLGYLWLRTWMAPPPKPIAQPNDAVAPDDPNDKPPQDDKPPVDVPDKPPDDDDPADVGDPQPAIEPADDEAEQPVQQWISLGSVDPDSGYRMLVTLTNRGASMVRVDLSSRKYSDLESTQGYLGYLALSDGTEGALVNVVGNGTPAAMAKPQAGGTPGLRAGDVLLEINGTAIESSAVQGFASHAKDILKETRPGEQVTLRVKRAAGDQSSILLFTADLTRTPMEVVQPEHVDVFDDDSALQPFSFLTSFSQIGKETIGNVNTGFSEDEIKGLPSLRDGNWEVLPPASPDEAAFRMVLDEADLAKINQQGKLEIIKRYRLAKVAAAGDQTARGVGYHLTMQIEVKNLGENSVVAGLDQWGPTGLPLEGWWYLRKQSPDWGAAGMRDVVWRSQDGPNKLHRNPVIVANAEQEPPEPTPLFTGTPVMRYVGVDGHYFSAVMLPDEDARSYAPQKFSYQYGEALVTSNIDEKRKAVTGVTSRLISQPFSIPAGESYEQQYVLFVGPKDPQILQQYGLQDTVIFGWSIFGLIARPLIWFLNVIYLVVRNYGVAIIILTVLVRLAVYPLGKKQAQNAAKMQELAPEMKKIADKHKDMEQRAKAQQELFRKHNYNPLGGCGLLFLQMPIFFGLYKALSVSIDLRQASFIPGLRWCSNLAGPDMLWFWKPYLPGFLADETGYLGPYLNILPLMTIVLFIVHQKLFTPPATDEQQQMQQKVMMFMMIFMGFLFFKIPSGLCLYFITSSLWGIAERKLLPKTVKPGETPPPPKKSKPLDEKAKDFMAMFKGQPAKSNGSDDQAKARARRKKKRK